MYEKSLLKNLSSSSGFHIKDKMVCEKWVNGAVFI